MSKSSRCEDGGCEFIPSMLDRQSSIKRSEDELRYGRLWAEVELPKLLACKEPKKDDNNGNNQTGKYRRYPSITVQHRLPPRKMRISWAMLR